MAYPNKDRIRILFVAILVGDALVTVDGAEQVLPILWGGLWISIWICRALGHCAACVGM
jgi:hypothetical protein